MNMMQMTLWNISIIGIHGATRLLIQCQIWCHSHAELKTLRHAAALQAGSSCRGTCRFVQECVQYSIPRILLRGCQIIGFLGHPISWDKPISCEAHLTWSPSEVPLPAYQCVAVERAPVRVQIFLGWDGTRSSSTKCICSWVDTRVLSICFNQRASLPCNRTWHWKNHSLSSQCLGKSSSNRWGKLAESFVLQGFKTSCWVNEPRWSRCEDENLEQWGDGHAQIHLGTDCRGWRGHFQVQLSCTQVWDH